VQEIFLCPRQQKLTKSEVKNTCKSAEEAKAEHLLLDTGIFSDSNKTRLALETKSTRQSCNNKRE